MVALLKIVFTLIISITYGKSLNHAQISRHELAGVLDLEATYNPEPWNNADFLRALNRPDVSSLLVKDDNSGQVYIYVLYEFDENRLKIIRYFISPQFSEDEADREVADFFQHTYNALVGKHLSRSNRTSWIPRLKPDEDNYLSRLNFSEDVTEEMIIDFYLDWVERREHWPRKERASIGEAFARRLNLIDPTTAELEKIIAKRTQSEQSTDPYHSTETELDRARAEWKTYEDLLNGELKYPGKFELGWLIQKIYYEFRRQQAATRLVQLIKKRNREARRCNFTVLERLAGFISNIGR